MPAKETDRKHAFQNSAVARALVVGLTRVNATTYRDHRGNPWDGRSGCWGCAEDVEKIGRLLEREGYEVTSLLDEEASHAAVLGALEDAARRAKAGDTFCFFYSGHGGQVEDQTVGTPGHDEDDGRDETLCLYDKPLRDDELGEVWKMFPAGAAIYFLSDCCHAGTNYRRMRNSSFVLDAAVGSGMKAALLHIGGSRDEQKAVGAEDGGAFTKALVRTWNRGSFDGNWDDFHDSLRKEFSNAQTPVGNLYGPAAEGLAKRRPFQPIFPVSQSPNHHPTDP